MFKKAIALCISLALLLTSMICVSAEVNLTASATITDAQNNIVFEPSTVQAGSLGWKEHGTIEDIIAPVDFGLQESGLYRITPAGGNGGWLPMYVYDATQSTTELTYNKTVVSNFTTAYKIDTSAYSGINSIKAFSGRIYSSTFNTDTPNVGIVVNYIDNGNYDFIYPYVSGGLWLRTWSVRTETLTENGLSYKKIYGSTSRLDQHGKGNFAISTETIGEETLQYIDFNVAYSSEGTVVTLTSGEATVTLTLADNYFLNYSIKNIINSAEVKAVSQFGNNTISSAKAVGFASQNSGHNAYVDNVSVTFDYNRSAADLADEFKNNHKDILDKNSVVAEDKAAVEAALAEYSEVIAVAPEVADLLINEKTKLEGFMASFADIAANEYLTEHSAALAITTETVSKENISLVNAAKTDYAALSDAVAAKVLASFNTTNSTDYTSLNTFFTELANKVYYDAKGNLVYDDMSGANADAWEKVTVADKQLNLVKAKPNARILEAKYNFTIVPTNLRSGSNPIVLYADDTDYILPNFAYDSGWDSTFFNGGSNTSGINSKWYYGSHLRSPAGTSMSALATEELTITVKYDYADFDGEATSLHPNFAYAAKHIDVTLKTEYKNIAFATETKMVGIMKGDENAPAIPNDIFNIGYYTNNENMKLNSVEFVYAKPADEYSAEFEAFDDTYTADASAITLESADEIDNAIAVYETLDEKKKEVYKANYENLLALKQVADFHKEVANTVVTPASEAAVAQLGADYAALQVENDAVAAAVAEKKAAFDAFRPDTHSATIKKTGNEEQQDLRFAVNFETNAFEGNIVSYGMIMVPNLALGDKELVIGGIYEYEGDSYRAAPAIHELGEGEEMPSTFYGYLSNSGATDNRCGTRIAARAFIIYEIDGVQYTLYSTESDAKVDANDVTKGVRNGVAVRSVYSIARAMATDLIASGTFNETDVVTSATTVADIAKAYGEEGFIAGADIIKFVAANVTNIENLVK